MTSNQNSLSSYLNDPNANRFMNINISSQVLQGEEPDINKVVSSETNTKKNEKRTKNDGNGLYRYHHILVPIVILMAIAAASYGLAIMNKNAQNSKATAAANLEVEQPSTTLLEIAEQVVLACSDENLSNGGFTDCEILCDGKACCFDEGRYSCVDNESIGCPAYAGCEVLME